MSLDFNQEEYKYNQLKQFTEILDNEKQANESKLNSKLENLEHLLSTQEEQLKFLKDLLISNNNNASNIEDGLKIINLTKENQLLNLKYNNLNDKISDLTANLEIKDETIKSLKSQLDSIKLESLNQIENKIVDELIEEMEKLKVEKEQAQEKAIDMLAEKELVIVQLREDIEHLKEDHLIEMGELVNKIEEIKGEINFENIPRKSHFTEDNNIYNEMLKLEEKYNNTVVALNNLKLEMKQQESLFNLDRSSFQIKLDSIEKSYKKHIEELMEINTKLQIENESILNEKKFLSFNLENENKDKDAFTTKIDELNKIINTLQGENSKLTNELNNKSLNDSLRLTNDYYELLHNLKLLENKNESLIESLRLKEEKINLKDKELDKAREKIVLLEKESKINLLSFQKSLKEYKKINNKLNLANLASSQVNDEGLIKENLRLKKDYKELKELYDVQINDLDQKLTLLQAKYNKILQNVPVKQTKFRIREHILINQSRFITGNSNSNELNSNHKEVNDKGLSSELESLKRIVNFLKEDNSKLTEKVEKLKSELRVCDEESKETILKLKSLIKENLFTS